MLGVPVRHEHNFLRRLLEHIQRLSELLVDVYERNELQRACVERHGDVPDWVQLHLPRPVARVSVFDVSSGLQPV